MSADLIIPDDPQAQLSELHPDEVRWLFENFSAIRDVLINGNGVSGSFTSADAKTITVTNGIITSIV